MKLIPSALFGLSLALAGSGAASATTVIDFDEYAFTGGQTAEHYFTSLTTEGFKFTNSINSLTVRSKSHFANADPGGATVTASFGGVTKVERADGGAFNLESFDFADYYNQGLPAISFSIRYFDGVKEGSRNLTYDAQRGLQTADLQLKNIQWFSIQNSQAQLDNFRVSDVATGAVPEPATWALMILGFGGAGAQLRSRRRQAARA